MKNKFVKKFLSLSLVAFMLVTNAAGTLNVSAQEPTSVSEGVIDFGRGNAQITITGNSGQSLIGKTFHVYRLFDAENSVGGESVNYTFNSEFQTALQTVVGKKISKETSKVTEYEVVDYIQSLNTNQVEGAQADQIVEGAYSAFRYFVEELRDEIKSEGITGDVVNVTSITENNSVVVEGLEYGYYIVDEATSVSETHSAASLCMVNTANPDAAINIKSDYPVVIKKILEDDNQSEIGSNADGWNDIGDYEIGQTVPYYFKSNISNMNGYDTYYYAWHDKMDEALTFHPDSVSITINQESTGKSYMLAASEFNVIDNPDNGETFIVEVSDIKAIVDREFNQMNALKENVYDQEVMLYYNATLNDKAALDMGRPGFENDVRLEFSNDPDHDGDGENDSDSTGYTPWDTVVCFTYQINILKTNDHGLKLSDAKFRLYSDADCTNEVYVKETEDGYNVINRDILGGTDHTGGEVSKEAVEMISNADGTIIINGFDSGTYYLKEIEAPTGYRKLSEPIVLTIVADFTDERDLYVKGEGATDKTLESLVATAHIKTFLEGTYNEEDVNLETNVDAGAVNITVMNALGKKLPITGSALMPIMCIVGVGLVAFSFSRKKEKE